MRSCCTDCSFLSPFDGDRVKSVKFFVRNRVWATCMLPFELLLSEHQTIKITFRCSLKRIKPSSSKICERFKRFVVWTTASCASFSSKIQVSCPNSERLSKPYHLYQVRYLYCEWTELENKFLHLNLCSLRNWQDSRVTDIRWRSRHFFPSRPAARARGKAANHSALLLTNPHAVSPPKQKHSHAKSVIQWFE